MPLDINLMKMIPSHPCPHCGQKLIVRIARGVFKLAPRGAEIAEEVRREQDEAASPTKPLPLSLTRSAAGLAGF